MKRLLSLALLGLVVTASVPAQGFNATYVEKFPNRILSSITFRRDGTCDWKSWKVKGTGRYTRKGNLLTIQIRSLYSVRKRQPIALTEKQGTAKLSDGGRTLSFLDSSGVSVKKLQRQDARPR